MYWLSLYEKLELERNHIRAFNMILCWKSTGSGFLNAINRYYGYRVWR